MMNKCKFEHVKMRDRVCDKSCEWFNTCTRRYFYPKGEDDMKTVTINCPKCGAGRTGVVENVRSDFNEVYKQRVCKNCHITFYTMECVIEEGDTFFNEWDELLSKQTIRRKDRKNEKE